MLIEDRHDIMEELDLASLTDFREFLQNVLSGNHTGDNDSIGGCQNTSSSSCSFQAPTQDRFRHTLNYLFVYITPVIIVVGVVGNFMSFLVFCFTYLQRLSSSVYLTSLALADVGFLGSLLFVWLDSVDVKLFSTEGWCQTIIYVMRVCEFLAVWYVVSFTAERYIMVYYPLRKDSFCTRRKAKIVALCLLLYSLAFYVYPFWTYDVIRLLNNKVVCSPLPMMHDTTTALSSIHTLQACVLPSLVIVVLNVRLMIKLHVFQRRYGRKAMRNQAPLQPEKRPRKSYIHTSVSTTGSMHIKFSSRPQNGMVKACQGSEVGCMLSPLANSGDGAHSASGARPLQSRSQYRTARMLLIISSVFVLLNLPNHGFRVQGFLRSLLGLSAKQTRSQYIWQEVFQIVHLLNFAINFFVYSACARQFRTGLRRLCRRWSYNLDKIGRMFRRCRELGTKKELGLDTLKTDRYV